MRFQQIYLQCDKYIYAKYYLIVSFSQKGTKSSQFAWECQSETFLHKNWMCHAQINPKDKIRRSVLVNKSLKNAN